MSDRNYYEILGVDRKASAGEIKTAYRQLAKQFHPDMNSDPSAARRFSEIDEAHDVLIDPESRRSYDFCLPPEPAPRETAPESDGRSGMQGAHGAAPSQHASDRPPAKFTQSSQQRTRHRPVKGFGALLAAAIVIILALIISMTKGLLPREYQDTVHLNTIAISLVIVIVCVCFYRWRNQI